MPAGDSLGCDHNGCGSVPLAGPGDLESLPEAPHGDP
jgi:hypothetical protein